MPASRAVILTYTMPLWSVVFARMMLGEKIDGLLRGSGLVLGAGGIAVLARPLLGSVHGRRASDRLVLRDGRGDHLGSRHVYTKKVQIPGAPIAITAWQILIGAIVCRIGLEFFETPRLELDGLRSRWLSLSRDAAAGGFLRTLVRD